MRNVKPVTWGFLALALVGFAILATIFLSLANSKPSQVLRVNSKNPKLIAAIKEARASLPVFIKELAAPKPEEAFAVKGTFQTPVGPEYLWVRHPEFKSGIFSGVLDQQPIALAGKRKGDSVSFKEKDAVDWLIKDDQGMRGAFTEKALSGQ